MSQVTGASYGLPPVAMPAMSAGISPYSLTSPIRFGTPAWHFVIPAYGAVLLIVAALYAYGLFKRR